MGVAATAANQVGILTGAIEKYREVQEMLHKAATWADEAVDQNDAASRAYLLCEMENSFNRSMLQLIFISQKEDGPLAIHGDSSPGSFFWHYEKSGYHGGLIFHKNHRVGGPIGTWSIHT